MSKEKVAQLQRHHVQWLEDFAFKLEKFTIFTILSPPKSFLFCALSFLFSATIYWFCYGLHLQHGLKPADKKYYEGMFWVERMAMFFLAVRDYICWGWLLWSLALALFACSYVIGLSNKGNLSPTVLMRTNINNDLRLSPNLVQGYIFWLERVTVIIVAAVPFKYLIGHYYYLAFGLLLVPAILSYILKPENNTLTLNPNDDAMDLVKETEKKNEADQEIEFLSLIQNHLFWLERVAILSSILFSAGRELHVIVSGVFHLVFSFARHDVDPSPIDLDLLFWIERIATSFLLAYGSDESGFYWYIAVVLFAITNTVYFINPIKHMLEILGSLLENCEMFEGFEIDSEDEDEEEKEVERLKKLEVEIKKLRSENNDLKRERTSHAQELERVNVERKRMMREREDNDLKRSLSADELMRGTEENVELKRLTRESEEKERSLWAQEVEGLMKEREDDMRERSMLYQELERIIEENEELKIQSREREENDSRERSTWAQELERITFENEEHKRLIREREDIWDERFDRAIAELDTEKQALLRDYQTLLLEKDELKVKLNEASSRVKALGEENNFLASASQQDVSTICSLEEEKRELVAMLEMVTDLLEHFKGVAAKKEEEVAEERRRWEEEQAEIEHHRSTRLLALEGSLAELRQEVEKLEAKCELYRDLLHNPPQDDYNHHNNNYHYYRHYY